MVNMNLSKLGDFHDLKNLQARRIVTGCHAVDVRFRLSRYMLFHNNSTGFINTPKKSHQECTKDIQKLQYDSMIELY